jgi:hypothetical protein
MANPSTSQQPHTWNNSPVSVVPTEISKLETQDEEDQQPIGQETGQITLILLYTSQP